MKYVIYQVLGLAFLGVGIYKGYEREVYLLVGITFLVVFSVIMSSIDSSSVQKKLDELIDLVKEKNF